MNGILAPFFWNKVSINPDWFQICYPPASIRQPTRSSCPSQLTLHPGENTRCPAPALFLSASFLRAGGSVSTPTALEPQKSPPPQTLPPKSRTRKPDTKAFTRNWPLLNKVLHKWNLTPPRRQSPAQHSNRWIDLGAHRVMVIMKDSGKWGTGEGAADQGQSVSAALGKEG